MRKFVALTVMLLSYFFIQGQSSLTEVKTTSGVLMVNKSDDYLVVYGTLKLSGNTASELTSKGLKDYKGKLIIQLNQSCQVMDIRLKEQMPLESVNNELINWTKELLAKIRSEKLDHLFQLNNDLGFVNADNCVDNLSVTIALETP